MESRREGLLNSASFFLIVGTYYNTLTFTHLSDVKYATITSRTVAVYCSKPSPTPDKSHLAYGREAFSLWYMYERYSYRGYLVKTRSRTRTRDKPFTCEVHNEKFTFRESLVKHSHIHTRKKLFVCEVGGKSFMQRGNLVKHTRIYTGDKPFTCEACKTCFTFSESLMRHDQREISPLRVKRVWKISQVWWNMCEFT